MSTCDVPPRPHYAATKVEELGDTLVLTFRTVDPALIYLGFWLLGLGFAGAFLIWAVVGLKQPLLLLLAIPFYIGWLFGASMITRCTVSYERWTLSPEGLAIDRYFFFPTSRRRFRLADLREIRVRTFPGDSDSSEFTAAEVLTLGRSCMFGRELSVAERNWLAHRFGEHLRRLQEQAEVTHIAETDPGDCRGCVLPRDSHWSADLSSPDLALVERGRLRLGHMFVVGIFGISWNSAVAINVAWLCGLILLDGKRAVGNTWGETFFALILMGAIGALVLAVLLNECLEPFRLVRWIFQPAVILKSTTRLGLPFGWRRIFEASTSCSAVIREDLGPEWRRKEWVRTNEHYGLLVADADNREICSITHLTLGEARWIKGALQEAGRVPLPDGLPAAEIRIQPTWH